MPPPNTTATLRPLPMPEPSPQSAEMPSAAVPPQLPVAPEPPVAPAMVAQNMSLPELDNTLAADFDQMLQGNFESIDAVLEGVFETQAVLVQNPGGAAVAMVRQPEIPPPPAPNLAPAPLPPPVAISAEVEPEPVVPSAALERTAEPIAAPDPALATDVAAAMTPSPPPSPSPAAPLLPSVVASTAAPAESAPPPAAARGGVNVFAALKAIIVRILMLLNYPIRLTPPSLRPVMNWTAITLLAWVPIVWFMAPLMARDGSSTAAAASEAQGTTQTAPLHDESSSPPAKSDSPSAPAGH